jgi:hypothetical protein
MMVESYLGQKTDPSHIGSPHAPFYTYIINIALCCSSPIALIFSTLHIVLQDLS